jgi:hypothetical protein
MLAAGQLPSLPLPRGFHPLDQVCGRDIKRVADPEQRVEGRRPQVPFELADVNARHTGPERKLSLGQSGPLAQPLQFAAHHATEDLAEHTPHVGKLLVYTAPSISDQIEGRMRPIRAPVVREA